MRKDDKVEKKFVTRVDLQCGSCGSLCHQDGEPPRYCPCCGAAYQRYCISCRKKVSMFFEEWWPSEDECVRTYSSAKRCPGCNAALDVELKGEPKSGFAYEH